MPDDGATPELVRDSPSGVVTFTLEAIRSSQSRIERRIDEHVKDDAKFQDAVWRRVSKLSNLRWYATGIIVALLVVGGVFYQWGPYFVRLGVSDVVRPQMRRQAEADREYIGAKLDAFKASVDDQIKIQQSEIKRRLDVLEKPRKQRRGVKTRGGG